MPEFPSSVCKILKAAASFFRAELDSGFPIGHGRVHLEGPLQHLGVRFEFRANDGVAGIELWKSDGTTAGTVLVKDIRPGADSSAPPG